MAARRACLCAIALVVSCDGTVAAVMTDADLDRDATARDAGSVPPDGTSPATPDAATPDAGPSGPDVDRTDPRLIAMELTARDADPAATVALGTELAYLDTRVEPRGKLVVYLHGAGAPTVCGSREMGEVLAGMGFHVLAPCYVSDYGVANCGDDIGGCRLEAFEGVDHHDFIDIAPPDSVERRVTRALQYLDEMNPGGDWAYFIDGDRPRWSEIVISGISHGASSSGLIGVYRVVDRVVMLSGPYDVGQAWLSLAPMTSIDRYWGFTHTDDPQHMGHLEAFERLGMPGEPVSVDGATAPYGGSHRLVSSASTTNGHSSVQAGSTSPRTSSGDYAFMPVWQTMYGP